MVTKTHKGRIAECKVSDIALVVSLVLVFKPYVIQSNTTVDTLWDSATLITSICFIISVLFSKKIKIEHILIILFCMIYCVSTYIHTPSNVLGAISESLRIILAFYSVTYCWSSIRLSPIKIIRFVCIILLFLDVAIGILNYVHPFLEGANYSLFGLDNYAIFYVLPLLGIVAVSDTLLVNKLTGWFTLLFLLSFALKIATGAITSIIALAFFGVLLLAIRRNNAFVLSLLSGRTWLLLVSVLTVGVVIFGLQNVFSDVLGMAGRDATLSYRTVIWNKTIDAIMTNPLIGYGKTGPGVFQVIVGLSPIYDVQATHAHNYILELLFDVGLVGSLVFVAFLFFPLKQSVAKLNKSQLLIGYAGLLGFSLLMFTDSYVFTPGLFVFIAVLGLCKTYSDDESGLDLAETANQ